MELFQFLWILEIIFLTNLSGSQAARSFDIRWTKASCIIQSPELIDQLTCTLTDKPRSRMNFFNVNAKFKQSIGQLFIDFRVSSGKNAELLKFRIDGCKMLKSQSGNPVVNLMLKKIVEKGNIPGGCPLMANYSYNVNNFALNADYFPPNTPAVNFTTKLNMITGKYNLLSVVIDASILKKNK